MGPFYQPGGKGSRTALGVRIYTDSGVTGEYMSIAPGTFEQIQSFVSFLIGKNALERSEEHTSELQSLVNIVCRLLLEKKKKK